MTYLVIVFMGMLIAPLWMIAWRLGHIVDFVHNFIILMAKELEGK